MAGGMRQGRKCKAVIPGGSSMYVVPGEKMLSVNMDYHSLQEAGSAIGSGGVIVMDDQTCMVSALENISRFYMMESCGQCTPCREGSGWTHELVKRILDKQADLNDLDKLLQVVGRAEGRTICALEKLSLGLL